MPPCHSDTLERLLKALHKVTENCEDSIGLDGQLVKTIVGKGSESNMVIKWVKRGNTTIKRLYIYLHSIWYPLKFDPTFLPRSQVTE